MLILKIWFAFDFNQLSLKGICICVFELLKSSSKLVFSIYFENTVNNVCLSTGFQVL